MGRTTLGQTGGRLGACGWMGPIHSDLPLPKLGIPTARLPAWPPRVRQTSGFLWMRMSTASARPVFMFACCSQLPGSVGPARATETARAFPFSTAMRRSITGSMAGPRITGMRLARLIPLGATVARESFKRTTPTSIGYSHTPRVRNSSKDSLPALRGAHCVRESAAPPSAAASWRSVLPIPFSSQTGYEFA